MSVLKSFLYFVLFISLTFPCFGQSEALKSVVNNLAFYKEKKDIKYLSNAKKSVDSLFTTHADSVDLQKNVYRALVYSSILYIDSLNKLKQPATFFTSTTQMVDKLIADKKIYKYQAELDYSKRCLTNVYIDKGFSFMQKSDFFNALKYFTIAKNYSPGFKPIDGYIAYANSKLGNLQTSAKFYTDLINSDSVKVGYIQAAAGIYRSLGDTITALETIKKGRKLFPEDKSLLLEEASVYNNRKDYQSLKNLIPDLLEINVNSADIAFVAADCYDHLKQYDKAASLYLRSIELNGSSYEPIFNLGLLYFKQSEIKNEKSDSPDMNRAVQWLQKANEISPNNVNGIKALQLAYYKTGNTDQINNTNYQLKQLTN